MISEILNSIEANQKYDNISRMDDSIKNSCESCCLIQNIVSVAQSVDETPDSWDWEWGENMGQEEATFWQAFCSSDNSLMFLMLLMLSSLSMFSQFAKKR